MAVEKLYLFIQNTNTEAVMSEHTCMVCHVNEYVNCNPATKNLKDIIVFILYLSN